MQNSTAATAATLEELAAEVVALRAKLAGHMAALKILTAEVRISELANLTELPPLPRPKLRVISCYTGRKRTARRGKLALVGGVR